LVDAAPLPLPPLGCSAGDKRWSGGWPREMISTTTPPPLPLPLYYLYSFHLSQTRQARLPTAGVCWGEQKKTNRHESHDNQNVGPQKVATVRQIATQAPSARGCWWCAWKSMSENKLLVVCTAGTPQHSISSHGCFAGASCSSDRIGTFRAGFHLVYERPCLSHGPRLRASTSGSILFVSSRPWSHWIWICHDSRGHTAHSIGQLQTRLLDPSVRVRA